MKKIKVDMIVKELQTGVTRTKVLLGQPKPKQGEEHKVQFAPPMLAVTVLNCQDDPIQFKVNQKVTVDIAVVE